MAYGLGVDLGTTFTAAAVVREGHVEMAPLGDRSTAMPSVILMRAEGGVLTGDAANRRAATEPDRVAREVKRRLGDPMPVLLGGTPYSAGDLMAAQLREVVAQISEREGGPPVAVRLTHPANWGPYKRELFEQVPRMAGLYDVTMITEPEAAAAHYAANERIADGTTVAVYDLGGGTFDATVLRTTGGGFEILGAPEGVEGLGGVDFDEAVFGHVDRSLDGAVSALDLSDPAATSAIVRLRQDCVLAKEALSSDTEATIPVLLPSLQTEVRLTRGEFETMIRPSVASTIASLQRALESADISAEQVDTVLLVGGSSRIPLVSQMVSGELGRPTSVDAHPKHAIVLGAASLAEPPARAAGPGAPGPAHTSVFPTSGAPFRTPVPRVGPRHAARRHPRRRQRAPGVDAGRRRARRGVGHQLRDDPDRRGPATLLHRRLLHGVAHGDARPRRRRDGRAPGPAAPRAAGTGAMNAGTGSAPTAAPRTGGTYTGPTALRPTYTGPTRTVPGPSGPRPDRGDRRRPQPGPPDPGRAGTVRAAPAVAGHPRRRWAAGRATTSPRPAGRAAGSP